VTFAAALAALTVALPTEPLSPSSPDTVLRAPGACCPDTILRPEGGPTLALFRAGSSEVVSIRASVPLNETMEEAGAGQLLRIQALERMESLASRIGARAEVHRTPQALVYQVSGSVMDLDYLGWILREGMAAPQSGRVDAAIRHARIELQRQMETPEGVLARRLVQALAPGTPPLTGSEGVLDRMDASRLTAIWARTHARRDVRVVVVGPVEPPLVLAAVSDLGLPEEGPTPQLPPLETTGDSRGSPEIIRHWMARAFELEEGTEAVALVVSRHLARLLRESPGDYEASVELWEVGRRRALVLSGAAYPRSRQALQSRLAGLLDEGLQALGPPLTRALITELETEIRLAARDPWGLAELAGQAWDTGGGPWGMAELLVALDGVASNDVRNLLETLAGRTPIQEELRP
jgi:hypothetical protein